MRRLLLVAAIVLGVPAGAATAAGLPAPPRGWPHRLEIGVADPPGGAAALRRRAPLGFRYQYLAGGANTGQGWATWNPNGTFVTRYMTESIAARTTPVFSYYMLLQSRPAGGDEATVDLRHLRSPGVMRAWWSDFELLLRRAAAFPGRRVVVHVEPDLWGYVEQAARADRAATVPAAVAASGLPELAGLPDDAAGLARGIVRLRDRLAPSVTLAYHLSDWGTRHDIGLEDPPAREVDALGDRAARFYRSLGARFDLAFTDVADRDAGFRQHVLGDGGRSWWNAGDFARNARFLGRFVRGANVRVALWQVPLGNTGLPDTWGRFRDNRVQWFLGPGGRTHLRAYARAGLVAVLFGGGADGTTGPGTDGGYFLSHARAYYRAGAIPLSRR
ncbi:MAG: hypothetical protein E6G30_05865 [Actinobacteria bacterium]|nr:MAG: hypothetical protein E6G30_05865 [Actinomycetota bacterium]